MQMLFDFEKNLCRNSADLIIVQPEQFVWFCIDNQSGDGRANGDFKTSLEDWINGLVIHSVEKHRPHFTVFIYAPPEKWCSVERTILDDWCGTRGQTRTRNTQRHCQSQQGLEILQSDSRLIIAHWERESKINRSMRSFICSWVASV